MIAEDVKNGGHRCTSVESNFYKCRKRLYCELITGLILALSSYLFFSFLFSRSITEREDLPLFFLSPTRFFFHITAERRIATRVCVASNINTIGSSYNAPHEQTRNRVKANPLMTLQTISSFFFLPFVLQGPPFIEGYY